MSISSISSSQGSIYQLIDQYMQIEQMPRDALIEKKNKLDDRKSIFSDLDSKLSALKTKCSYLTDVITDRFAAKSASSSDPDIIGVTAEGSAVNGNHSISVDRLAKSDTRVSDQFNDSGTSFSGFSTDQTFTIEVAHPTDEDANNRVSIDVTVSASVFSGTDDEVLSAIADAVNTAMANAVNDETIDNDEVAHASVVTEETGKSRLVFGSELSGYTNRMDFGASSLLDTLNINADQQSSGASGGYITNVGTSPSDSELNSKFTMDGLIFYRDSNTVTDALGGVTFKLLDTFSQAETITITSDVDSVKSDVQGFIDAYNEAVTFLRDNARMNPDTYEKGELANDYIYSNIVYDLRSLVSGSVSTTTSDDYTLFYNIGIEAAQDGTLSITDADKLTNAIETNSIYVSDLFNTDDGVAKRIEDYVDNFVETNGTIDSSKDQIDDKITNLNDRISYMNDVLEKKEKQYYEEFTKLQETMYLLQNQQTFISSFTGNSYY